MANKKVLIVDDDEIIIYVEKWRLSKLGYDVCGTAGTGAEALQCVADTKPDIVLMDINLKEGGDGIETAKKIKEDFNIPVIFVSAYIDQATISRAKAIGPDGFLRKPFDDDDMRIALEMGLKK
jgi:CheY-like chemotaxis protein